MAQAAQNFVRISLDGDKGPTRPIMKKFGVRGYPTVLFLKPDEEVIEKLGRRDPESVKAQMDRIYKEYAKEAANVTWAETIDEAREQADDQLVFVFFHDEKKGSKLMDKITLSNLNVLMTLGKNFICVRVEFDRKSDVAKQYRITSAPTMLVTDADGNKIAAKSGAKKPKDAIKFLEKALKTAEKAKKKASKEI